ncbi:MAG: hypothetical protein F6K47_13900 [Symploca sp. SIO2E6]|nr:hypothetical protein [Symploca sp. SIO2E6]
MLRFDFHRSCQRMLRFDFHGGLLFTVIYYSNPDQFLWNRHLACHNLEKETFVYCGTGILPVIAESHGKRSQPYY